MRKQFRNTHYEVDESGNIFNINSGKILKQQTNGRYKKVTLTIEGFQKQFLVHRIVAECFLPNLENKKEVNHKNGDKQDNRVINLEWVTPKENQIHSVKAGLRKYGTDLWNGKFNKEQVLEIIQRKTNGESCRKLGKEYNVDATTISAISRGLRYKKYFLDEELQHAMRLCKIDKEIEL